MTETQLDLILRPFTEMVELDYDYYSGTLYIYNFYVPPEHRSKGWASQIFRIMIVGAKIQGLTEIRAHIAVTNTDETVSNAGDPTVRLFNSLGFTILGLENTVEAKYQID